MRLLLTGATGTLGRALVPRLLERGDKVYALVRDPSKRPQGCFPLIGDVTKPSLGQEECIHHFDQVWNMAGVVNLKGNKETLKVNALGAKEVALFAEKHQAERFLHVSTAYIPIHPALPRNKYELSKSLGEEYVRTISVPTTIIKPSIMVAQSQDMTTADGAFYQFVRLICQVHRRAELVRRKIEGTLRLPVIEPVFRLRGNPDGRLNLIPVDVVAKAMVEMNTEGTYYLTNPNPPKLSDLASWVGEILLLKMVMKEDFSPTLIERVFEHLASPFLPYLEGDKLPSDLKECPVVDRDFIQQSTLAYLLKY